MPQPLILEELREFGIDISAGQVNRILIENKERFHAEQQEVLQAGLETAEYVHCRLTPVPATGGKMGIAL